MRSSQLLGVILTLFIAVQIAWGEYAPRHLNENDVRIRQGYHIEWARSGEKDADGNVIYTWSDTRRSDRDVYAQKVSPAGDKLWEDKGALIISAPGRQEDPSLIPTGFGDYIFIWADFRDDTATGDLYAQKVDANGNILWDSLGVLLSTGDMTPEAATLRIVSDGTGGAIVLWIDMRHENEDIYATRIMADGTIPPEWSQNGLVVTDAPASQNQPTVDTDGRGGAIIAWMDNQDTGIQRRDIYIQRVTINGQLAWSPSTGVPVCQADNDQELPKLCPDGSGGAYIVWKDMRDDGQGDLYFHHVSENGALVFPEQNGKPLIVHDHLQWRPRIVADGSGNAIIIWLDQRNNPLFALDDIYAQKVNSDGDLLWAINGNAVCIDSSGQTEARVNADGTGGAVCIWMDERNGNETPKNNIFAQKINGDGSMAWAAGGVPVCEASGYQLAPLVSAFSDYTLIAWGDERAGSLGVWYQKLSSAGAPQLPVDGDTLIWGISGNADHIKLVKDNQGKVFVFFQDLRKGEYTAYVQILDTLGNVCLEEDGRPICPNPSYTLERDQEWIDACSDGANGAIAVWQDNRDSNPGRPQIYAQRVGPEGALLWGDSGIQIAPYDKMQNQPQIVEDGSGGAIIVWSEQTPSWDNRVRAARVDQGGGVLWIETIADTIGIEDLLSDIAPDGSGGAYVCYQSDLWEFGYNVYAQRVDASGNLVWGENRFPICTDTLLQLNCRVAGLGSEGAIFVWEDQRNYSVTRKDLYAQKVSADGTVLWPENGLVINDNVNDQSSIDLALDGMDHLFIVWNDFRDSVDIDLYIQKLSTLNGQKLFPESGLAFCLAQGEQSSLRIISDGSGGNYIFWSDGRFPPGSDIYCTHLDSAGELSSETVPGWPSTWVEDGNILSDAFHKQDYPAAIDDYVNGAVVVWEDKRSTGKEELVNLYAQRLNGYVVGIGPSPSGEAKPFTFALHNPFPNPFNPDVKLRYDLEHPGVIRLAVYDILGRQVKILKEGWHKAGSGEVTWRAGNLASGVYVVRLEVEDHQMEQKIILLK